MRVAAIATALLIAGCATAEPNPMTGTWYYTGPQESTLSHFDATKSLCDHEARSAYYAADIERIPALNPKDASVGYYNDPAYARAGANLTSAIVNLTTPTTSRGMSLAQAADLMNSCMRSYGYTKVSKEQAEELAKWGEPAYGFNWR